MGKYLLFLSNRLQTVLQYRVGFLMMIVTNVFLILAKYFLWQAMYSAEGKLQIAGFSLDEMVLYVLVSSLVYLLIQTNIEHEIAREVMQGEIAVNLIRPVNYLLQKFFISLAYFITNFLFVVVPLILLATIFFPFGSILSYHWIPLSVGILLAFVINFFFSAFSGLIAFWTTNTWGFQMLKLSLISFLSGWIIPLDFFPEYLAKIASILPFKSLVYDPVMIFLGKAGDFNAVAILLLKQGIWLALFSAFGLLMWNRGIRKISILGG